MLFSMTRPIQYDLQQNDMSKRNCADTSNISFNDILSQVTLVKVSKPVTSIEGASSSTKNINSYLSQLHAKFGTKISVQNMEYSKANINHIGSSTAGTGNVIIASNILEKMASDPKARQYYEKKIQGHFDTIGEANAFMAMHGRRIVSRGVIIHPNGEVTYYSSSDYTPEEKARLEKAMKEEDEAKAKKRAEEKKLNEIAQNRYWLLASNTVPKVEVLSSNISDHYYFQTLSNIDISLFPALMYHSTMLR